MLIVRDGSESCQPSLSCNAQATDPTQQSNGSSYQRPGPQRYIGVGMVAGALFLALVLWLWAGGWPMNKLLRHPWRCRRRKRLSTGQNNKDILVDLTERGLALEKPKRVHIKDAQDALQLGSVEPDSRPDVKLGDVPSQRQSRET